MSQSEHGATLPCSILAQRAFTHLSCPQLAALRLLVSTQAVTRSPWPVSAWRDSPEATSYRRSALSAPHTSISCPSDDQARSRTAPWGPRSVRSGKPLTGSHSVTALSSPPVASSAPWGAKRATWVAPPVVERSVCSGGECGSKDAGWAASGAEATPSTLEGTAVGGILDDGSGGGAASLCCDGGDGKPAAEDATGPSNLAAAAAVAASWCWRSAASVWCSNAWAKRHDVSGWRAWGATPATRATHPCCLRGPVAHELLRDAQVLYLEARQPGLRLLLVLHTQENSALCTPEPCSASQLKRAPLIEQPARPGPLSRRLVPCQAACAQRMW